MKILFFISLGLWCSNAMVVVVVVTSDLWVLVVRWWWFLFFRSCGVSVVVMVGFW